MKYIIFRDNISGVVQPVFFAEHTTHSDVTIKGATPVSAGFYRIDQGQIICYLDSVSLNLTPKPGDNEYIMAALLNCDVTYFIPKIDENGQ